MRILVLFALIVISGCETTEPVDEVKCENHWSVLVDFCREPEFANDEQCVNPCG